MIKVDKALSNSHQFPDALMLVLAALENWYITGLNIRSTYLYGKLDKEIYMEQPEGFAAAGWQWLN